MGIVEVKDTEQHCFYRAKLLDVKQDKCLVQYEEAGHGLGVLLGWGGMIGEIRVSLPKVNPRSPDAMRPCARSTRPRHVRPACDVGTVILVLWRFRLRSRTVLNVVCSYTI